MAVYTAGFSNTSYMYLKVTATESEINTANNTSKVTVKVELVSQNGGHPWASDVKYPLLVQIDGETVHNSNHSYKVPSGGSYVLGTYSKIVTHNNDGSKSCGIYVKFTANSSHGSASISKSLGLTNIARASVPTISTGSQVLGSAITIYTNRKASFTHTIEAYFGNWSGTLAGGVTDNFTWTLPYVLANQIPNATSGKGTIRLITYNGNTQIGYKDIEFIAIIPDTADFRPSFSSISHSERNATVASKIGKYVQNLSSLNIAINGATGAYSSTIKSYSISFDNKTYGVSSTATSVIIGSGTIRITATITDSRGRTYSSYVDVPVLAYTSPKLTSVTVTRCNADGTANLVGEYAKVAIVAEASSLLVNSAENVTTIKIDSKPRTSGTYINLGTSTFYGGLNTSYIYDGFVIINSFDIRVTWSDQFSSVNVVKTLSTGSVPFTMGKTGIGAGKVWEKGGLDVGGEAYFNDSKVYGGLRYATYLSNTSNLNDILEEWVLGCDGSNYPGSGYWYVNTIIYSSPNQRKQIAYGYTSDEVYTRRLYSSSWSNWIKVSSNPLDAYPVGAIYMSTVSTSPATLFGGTWSQITDRFLLGAGGSYGGAGNTGGAASHTLTKDEMPAHDHGLNNLSASASSEGYGNQSGKVFGSNVRTQTSGVGVAHNNMPPYYTVYMWRRTA